MRLAYSSNAYMKFSVVEAIDRVADLGFAGMELMADEPHAWPLTITDVTLSHIRDRLAARGLRLSNINAFPLNAVQDFWHPAWIEPDADFRRIRVQHTVDALHMAARIGAPCVTTEPGGPLPKGMERDRALDTFVAGLREALAHAEQLGVQLLVEPEPGLLIENAAEFIELAQRVESPMFGLNLDVGHFFCVGDPLPQTIAALQRYTRHYHLEDIAATRVHEHLIPGRGAIDFVAVIDAIRATGYRGWLTIELYPYLDDPDGAGREAAAHLAPLISP